MMATNLSLPSSRSRKVVSTIIRDIVEILDVQIDENHPPGSARSGGPHDSRGQYAEGARVQGEARQDPCRGNQGAHDFGVVGEEMAFIDVGPQDTSLAALLHRGGGGSSI
ncbi:hypothetical protein Nepgr_010635 [Nepenthes gracilis]|uniref:Uncharacterized protein n=1 Tax=Nepenthes gracilis TaxID=150966 RepID=A0AAD3SCQ3_NEPGR|nr:hypothetical protein Nepgr_010635 [Nepenthes gracilis]